MVNMAMLSHNAWGGPHGPGGWHGGPPWAGLIGLLLFAVIIGVGLYLARRRPAASVAQAGQGSNAEQVLGERFARGEVTEQEYVARLTVLRENRRE